MDVSLVDAYCLMDYHDVGVTVTQDSDLYHVYDNVVMAILDIVYDNVRMPSYTKIFQELGY